MSTSEQRSSAIPFLSVVVLVSLGVVGIGLSIRKAARRYRTVNISPMHIAVSSEEHMNDNEDTSCVDHEVEVAE